MTLLENITFVAHHGSPGTPEDFFYIQEELKKFNWHAVDRYNGDNGPSQGSLVQLGYSWGSVNAIRSALKFPESTKAVILISPYMFIEKKMSSTIKTLLSLPLLGDLLLSKMAPKSIEKMLVDSSLPSPVPSNYANRQDVFSDPKVLRPALFEKDIPTQDIISDLERLKNSPTPVLVIRGEADKTSGDGEQFRKLTKHLNYSEVVIKDGGHALPWTHTQGVVDEIKKFLSNFNQ